LGQPYKPFWQVDRNAVHDIPVGAAFCIEGFRRRIRFEPFGIEGGSSCASLRVTESKLRKKTPEPVFYWQVGKGARHEMPEMAVVRFKIEPLVRCELMLTAVFAVLAFSITKSPKSGKNVKVQPTAANGGIFFMPALSKKGMKGITALAWCLDNPKFDSVEEVR
jgi:hypothetical protein